MRRATPADKNHIINILCKSFNDNYSVNYIIKQDERRMLRMIALMDYSFEICMRFGDVWLSDDGNACGLVLNPQNKQATLALDIQLIFKAIGIRGIKKAMDREKMIRIKKPAIPMLYIWFIGVAPAMQHKGVGSKLLQEIIAQAQGLPVYLETSNVKNLPWYRRFGFEIYEQLTITHTLYFLRR
jgi:ribosomal protein S18 acetylase RimI-like enzyme